MGITLSHMPSTLFMANENVANMAVEQRIVSRQNASAWQTKDGVNVFELESPNQRLSTSDLFCHVGSCVL
jgi:hypothetical protein